MSFFKNALASMVGTIFAIITLTGLLVLLIVFAVIGSKGGPETKIEDASVLHIELDGTFQERANEKGGGFDPFGAEQGTGIDRFMADLEQAAKDDRIKGIFLDVKMPAAAPSTMRDLRNAISAFRESGKWVVAYSEFYTQGGYYLASAADEVYLYPEGEMDWRGLNAEVMFLKNMLDKLEIEAQIIRGPDNKFKSALEPFMYDKMSDANREQTATFIGDIWRLMLEDIAESRNITVDALNLGADSLSYMYAPNAVDAGLINGLKYRDEVIAMMRTKLGIAEEADSDEDDKKADDLPLVSMSAYHRDVKDKEEDEGKSRDRIAVVYAVGSIESGEGSDQVIGSDRIAKALREAREDKHVKAIVFRVSSPGGSALASDVIWRETKLIREAGKPLVVSMGDYAASGGYYISCAADKIYANPNTITGSIGVFGVIPNMEKFLKNKIGITFDRYETNPHADMMSGVKPLDPKEMKSLQDMVSDIYTDFITKVAEGRGLTTAQVDSIGQGRVWSGEDAKQIGLVDELGDLDDAIAAAAALAGLTDYKMKKLPEMEDPFQKFMDDLNNQEAAQAITREAVYRELPLLRDLESLRNMKGVQARLPFLITIN
ncbi:MAG: signal peptide peptidase SppA [Flavobacteriales bacterium]